MCLHEQTQMVVSAACRVDSGQFHCYIASLPLVSLLFIAIPTPFLNFFKIFIYLMVHLDIFQWYIPFNLIGPLGQEEYEKSIARMVKIPNFSIPLF